MIDLDPETSSTISVDNERETEMKIGTHSAPTTLVMTQPQSMAMQEKLTNESLNELLVSANMRLRDMIQDRSRISKGGK